MKRSDLLATIRPFVLRWIDAAAGGGGLLADHDHSGDLGDGGPFDATNLGSGAATDGQILTADGAGAAAWEAGSMRFDHIEVGSATGAGEGEVKTSGGLTVGAATGSVLTDSVGKYLGGIAVAKSSRGRIIMNLASGFYLAVGNAQNGYSYTAAWIHVAGAAGTINVTECTAQMTFSFTDDDLYIDNTSSIYDNFFIYSVIKFA